MYGWMNTTVSDWDRFLQPSSFWQSALAVNSEMGGAEQARVLCLDENGQEPIVIWCFLLRERRTRSTRNVDRGKPVWMRGTDGFPPCLP